MLGFVRRNCKPSAWIVCARPRTNSRKRTGNLLHGRLAAILLGPGSLAPRRLRNALGELSVARALLLVRMIDDGYA